MRRRVSPPQTTLWFACRPVADFRSVACDGREWADIGGLKGADQRLSGFREGACPPTALRAAGLRPCSNPGATATPSIRACISEGSGWQPAFRDLTCEATFVPQNSGAPESAAVSLAPPDHDLRQDRGLVRDNPPVGVPASAGLVVSLSRLRTLSPRELDRPLQSAGLPPTTDRSTRMPALRFRENAPPVRPANDGSRTVHRRVRDDQRNADECPPAGGKPDRHR